MNGAGTKEVKYVSNFIPSLSNAPKVIIVRRLTRLMTGLKGNGRLIRKKRRAKMQTKKSNRSHRVSCLSRLHVSIDAVQPERRCLLDLLDRPRCRDLTRNFNEITSDQAQYLPGRRYNDCSNRAEGRRAPSHLDGYTSSYVGTDATYGCCRHLYLNGKRFDLLRPNSSSLEFG
jgi:hypothetical protein